MHLDLEDLKQSKVDGNERKKEEEKRLRKGRERKKTKKKDRVLLLS